MQQNNPFSVVKTMLFHRKSERQKTKQQTRFGINDGTNDGSRENNSFTTSKFPDAHAK